MQTFNIITTPDYLPEKFLKNIRLVLLLIFTGLFSLILIGVYFYNIHSGSSVFLIILVGITFLSDRIIGLKLKKIGRFSFDDRSFEKSIGDFTWKISLEKIKLVRIDKHLVYLMPFFNNSIYRTLIVTISAHDGTTEKFIVDNDNGLFLKEIKRLKLKRPGLIRIGKAFR